MAIFEWFDTEDGDELARAIVTELVTRVPPSTLPAKDKKAATRLRNTHDAIFARAGKFARTRKLNVYKKARLANQFRWALKDAGYPPEFVESWTYELATLVALASRGREKTGS
ncbi:MAG: hypothetical protein A3F74_25940 [Betaproteobacteria bacterium RIFCSPLOWO2_12_FULL_62_58]|nr:MAG: hypothetical protein A3F74_25940 [Betaproteobacteria bacterium RIFCSPLOWO2_12_FULL_62_58]